MAFPSDYNNTYNTVLFWYILYIFDIDKLVFVRGVVKLCKF